MCEFRRPNVCAHRIGTLVLVIAFSLSGNAGFAKNDQVAGARLLADLSAQIIGCSIHPCLGDSEDEVRKLLSDRVVSDRIFYLSDIEVAYPQTRGLLQGLVEWDWDGGQVDIIGFKIVQFDTPAAVFIHELEQTLPNCEMDKDDDDGKEWSCLAADRTSCEVFVEVYFGPGLVLLELGD